ncbi:hypothetical protein HDU97_006170 [Phlyctochytrium planicorne]|nr:hypothetical protein HDU97_006170 [Phlyctochytrium planicorne]
MDCIAPIAVLYSTYHIYSHLQKSHLPSISFDNIEFHQQPLKGFKVLAEAASNPWGFFISTVIPFYLFLEASFFVFFLLQRARLQKIRPVPQLSDHDRPRFFFRIMDELPDDWAFRKFFAGWFYWNHNQSQLLASEFHEIYRNDMKDWLAWSMYSAKSHEEVGKGPNGRAHSSELEQFVRDMEQTKRIRFEAGRNPNITPVRLNFNNVEAYPKPLFLYTLVYLAESFGNVVLRVMGFDKYSSKEERFFASRSGVTTPSITYWARFPEAREVTDIPKPEEFEHMFDEIDPFSIPSSTPRTPTPSIKKDQLPIVFFHGIGAGLFCYAIFIYRLITANPNRAIFLVELPYVS